MLVKGAADGVHNPWVVFCVHNSWVVLYIVGYISYYGERQLNVSHTLKFFQRHGRTDEYSNSHIVYQNVIFIDIYKSIVK